MQAGLVPKRMPLTEWAVGTLCAAHCAHNALKWGITEVHSDGEVLNDVWKMMSVVRHASDTMQLQVKPWLSEVINWAYPHEPAYVQARRQAWALVGFPYALIDVISLQLELEWDGRCLWVSKACRGKPWVFDRVLQGV